MRIIDALPPEKYAKAAAHARTAEFLQKRDTSIRLIREWMRLPYINKKVPPALWFSYGKDSMAVSILLKMAGVGFTPLTVHNGGDVPAHELIYEEWDRWFGHSGTIFRTPYRYVEYIRELIDWGVANGITKKDGTLVDFFDLGPLEEALLWNVSLRFDSTYAADQEDVVFFWANRGAEGMYKYYKLKQYGLLQRWGGEKGGLPYFQAEPIGFWRDIDVWALLVSADAPISPVYSMHALPQRSGKNTFPQTLWYPSSVYMGSTFYKWMSHYCPSQLAEMLQLFPEIPAFLDRRAQEKKQVRR